MQPRMGAPGGPLSDGGGGEATTMVIEDGMMEREECEEGRGRVERVCGVK